MQTLQCDLGAFLPGGSAWRVLAPQTAWTEGRSQCDHCVGTGAPRALMRRMETQPRPAQSSSWLSVPWLQGQGG